ncbi:dynein axonemal assembly factor 3 homolog [Phlebotomus argentipes]|uniref:dynein axonemal assembly factor 3 homolog n=1 Tax=Phlebotomus argentipes TaxID=94469 RepID=UPI00289344FE|nr:dynein axonemal assembly factor 3 homolog [Phlebotomus argentipes]
MFWGWSEAVNLVEKWQQYAKDQSLPGDFNVLLFGPGDPRHILAVLAKSHCLPADAKVHFYLLDSCMEHVARNLLLLTVALEDGREMSLRGKTHLFMDIFGNSHLRPSSANYIRARSKFLIKSVTDSEFAREHLPLVSLERLKYRKRDQLEATMSFWTADGTPFPVQTLWNARLRENLGQRFDYRSGMFDWDLQMQLKDRGAGQICPQEYSSWRETGVAFVFPEFEQSIPNKTLALKHQQRNQWLFLGDMTSGPFIAFGLTCADEKMLKSQHGVNDYRATDVTERNLTEIFFEMLEKKPFSASPQDSHRFGAATIQPGVILPSSGLGKDSRIRDNMNSLLRFSNISVTFLSPDDVKRFLTRADLQEHFSVIFVGQNFFPCFTGEFIQTLHRDGVILFETRRFTTFRKDKVGEFSSQIREFSVKNSLKSVNSSSINQHYSLLVYKKA